MYQACEEGEYVQVEKRRLECPRCHRLTKVYEVMPGARGVKKLCDRCQRIDEDGMGRGRAGEIRTIRKDIKYTPPVVITYHPSQAFPCESREVLALANTAASRCPAVEGIVPVLAFHATDCRRHPGGYPVREID